MDKDIAAGWYCTEDGRTTSVAHWLDEGDFRNNGGVMNHETLESMSKRRKCSLLIILDSVVLTTRSV